MGKQPGEFLIHVPAVPASLVVKCDGTVAYCVQLRYGAAGISLTPPCCSVTEEGMIGCD